MVSSLADANTHPHFGINLPVNSDTYGQVIYLQYL